MMGVSKRVILFDDSRTDTVMFNPRTAALVEKMSRKATRKNSPENQ